MSNGFARGLETLLNDHIDGHIGSVLFFCKRAAELEREFFVAVHRRAKY
jgi:hypothetical protein